MNEEQWQAVAWLLDEVERCGKVREPPDSPFWNDFREARNSFSHIHVAGTTAGLHIDTCALCGSDLRSLIHNRVTAGTEP